MNHTHAPLCAHSLQISISPLWSIAGQHAAFILLLKGAVGWQKLEAFHVGGARRFDPWDGVVFQHVHMQVLISAQGRIMLLCKKDVWSGPG